MTEPPDHLSLSISLTDGSPLYLILAPELALAFILSLAVTLIEAPLEAAADTLLASIWTLLKIAPELASTSKLSEDPSIDMNAPEVMSASKDLQSISIEMDELLVASTENSLAVMVYSESMLAPAEASMLVRLLPYKSILALLLLLLLQAIGLLFNSD